MDQSIIDETIKVRRHFHQNAELSNQEFKTSQFVQNKLLALGIPFKTGYAGTGVLGVIEGSGDHTIGLRADMDALPIVENSGETFTSVNEGVMHACGHDAHTAMLLSVAKVLNDRRDELNGRVLLIFQPAEENGPIGGSNQMMEDGVFDEYTPEVLIAQHVWPNLPVGQFGVMSGPIMGNSDKIKITVKGNGGHASMPHDSIDAVVVGAQIVNALQTIVSRNVNPFQSAVVTIGKFDAGIVHNVICERAELLGTVRTDSDETKAVVKPKIFEVAKNIATAHGAEVEVEYIDGYPAVQNTEKWADQLRHTLQNMYGEESVPHLNPSLAGEDFSRFLLKYPGIYYWLGSSIGEGQKPLHNPGFKLNEACIKYGIESMSQMAIDTLNALSKND